MAVTDQGICFRTVPGKSWECFWTLSLDKGQLTVEGPLYDTGDSVLAITGGTGEYAGALGEMALSARGTDGKAYGTRGVAEGEAAPIVPRHR